jgi:hypothetical protein
LCDLSLGGIRCERATALVNQLSSVNPDFKPEAVYELQGGIERYLKTYPEGGYWKGKNYLFDRRMEQLPEEKKKGAVEADIDSKCAVCRRKWTVYRGKFKCSQGLCGVPVIVCDDCKAPAASNPKKLLCELCLVGHKAPQLMPDLVGLKRKAEKIEDEQPEGSHKNKSSKTEAGDSVCNGRLFLSRLPLTATKTKVSELLGEINVLHWLVDTKTGGFYGSCMVELKSKDEAETAVNASTAMKMDKKKIKISLCRDDQVWPPPDLMDREYPPVGRYVLVVFIYYFVCVLNNEHDEDPTRQIPLAGSCL